MTPARAELAAAAERSRRAALAWRQGDAHAQAAAAFAPVAADDLAAAEQAAAALLDDGGWVGRLLAPLIAALAADPWREPPLRVNRDPLRSGAILFECPAATLTATVLSAAALADRPEPASLVVAGRVTLTRYVRAGDARLRRWRAPVVGSDCTAAAMGRLEPLPELALADGMLVRHDGRTTAQQLTAAHADVVTLTATLRAGMAPVSREYDRASGAFVRMATSDEGAARAQVLLTLLRVAGATDANPCFDAATRDGAFFLRWSAMREWLAHDWRAAWPRLEEMAASDPHREIRATATATRDQLIGRRAA